MCWRRLALAIIGLAALVGAGNLSVVVGEYNARDQELRQDQPAATTTPWLRVGSIVGIREYSRKVKERGQVTRSAKTSERHGLCVGDYVEVREEGNRVVLVPQAVAPRHVDVLALPLESGPGPYLSKLDRSCG